MIRSDRGGVCNPLATEWLACKYSVYSGSKLQESPVAVFCQLEKKLRRFPSIASAPYCAIRTVLEYSKSWTSRWDVGAVSRGGPVALSYLSRRGDPSYLGGIPDI